MRRPAFWRSLPLSKMLLFLRIMALGRFAFQQGADPQVGYEVPLVCRHFASKVTQQSVYNTTVPAILEAPHLQVFSFLHER